MKNFYAYHGPTNNSDFDPIGGYGVSQEYKQKQTEIGDLVYVIQKRPDLDFYELCGIYEISGHYFQELSKRPYRLKLRNKNVPKQRIVIDEEECSKNLPLINGDDTWSNFKRHFCRQGVSLQSPLEPRVLAVLSRMLSQGIVDAGSTVEKITDFESKFSKELTKAMRRSSSERLLRLEKANKVPKAVNVLVKVFVRNPDVVAETLSQAEGICGKCGQVAPFNRRADNSPYLEVHL